jgi:hypothetical protein
MFTIEYAKNLKWCDAEYSIFECTVKYAEFNEEMPTGVNAIDPYPHIKELWEKGNAGLYGVIEPYTEPEVQQEDIQKEQPVTQGVQTF